MKTPRQQDREDIAIYLVIMTIWSLFGFLLAHIV